MDGRPSSCSTRGRRMVELIRVHRLDERQLVRDRAQVREQLRDPGAGLAVLAEDEGHGFRKKTNRDYNAAVMSLFLERYVLEEPPARERPEYVIH